MTIKMFKSIIISLSVAINFLGILRGPSDFAEGSYQGFRYVFKCYELGPIICPEVHIV